MSNPLNLFYSYCHQDNEQRDLLKRSLAMLKRNGIICEWYDGEITAGSDWNYQIIEKIQDADIVVFLITTNWLHSDSCTGEWTLAKSQVAKQPNKLLIPIIAENCAWEDFDDMKSKQVLPKGGKPISKWEKEDEAWLGIYEGIKLAAQAQKKNSD